MEYWAHLQWLCEHVGIIRVFEKDKLYRIDPYCLCMTCIVKDRYPDQVPQGSVEIIGLDQPINVGQFRAVYELMSREKWRIFITRIKDGQERMIEICPKKWEK